MAGGDVFASLVSFLADLGHEVATLLTDPDARADLLARAGRQAAALPPAADPGTAQTFAALRDRASADGPIALELLRDLANAMIDLVALAQEVTAEPSADACLEFDSHLARPDRDRPIRANTNLEAVALLKATHLLSDERLLVTDLIRARDQWGSFLLGNPTDDGARADNMSLILAATFAVIGKWIPQEDDQKKSWRTDMLFGWDPDPASPAPRAQRALQRTATLRFTHRDPFRGGQVEEHAGFSATVVPPADGGGACSWRWMSARVSRFDRSTPRVGVPDRLPRRHSGFLRRSALLDDRASGAPARKSCCVASRRQPIICRSARMRTFISRSVHLPLVSRSVIRSGFIWRSEMARW